MSVLTRFRSVMGFETRNNVIENPSVSLASPGIWSWLSNSEPTASGEMVSQETALQIVTVFACVKAIAEGVASLPLRLYERSVAGKTEATDTPLHTLLSVTPNPEMTSFSFWLATVGSMAIAGNAYSQIQRDNSGEAVGLWPLNARLTMPFRLPNGQLAYKTSDGMRTGETRIIASADMFHCPLFSLDGILGLSPIEQARQTLGLARAAEKFGSRFFGSGARPGGVLSTPAKLDDKALALAKDTWASAQGGANQGKTALLMGDWKYEPLSLSPEEGQFLQTQEFTRQQIAALFRVPPHLAGDPSRLSDNNQASSNLSFLQDCLSSYIHAIEAEVQRKLLSSDYFARFDTGERLRSDLTQTMNAIALGRQWSILRTNEARGMLGLDPISDELGGSTILQPVNMTNLAKPQVAEPTQDGSMPLSSYRSAYLGLFRDAVRRVCNRSKRDAVAVSSTFEPLLNSLADLTVTDARSRTGQSDFEHDSAKVIRDYLGKLTERAATWTLETADDTAATELSKAMRALAFDTNRAAVNNSVQKDLEIA